MGDHSTDAVAGTRFRGRTVRIVVVAETEQADLRPVAEAIEGALGIATDASVRMTTHAAEEDPIMFDPFPAMQCPLCDGPMVGTACEERVILECNGQCRREWSVPKRYEFTP